MFLKQVYRYNKWLFTGMLIFIIMQILVFYKGGMVFSPWYNFGMYSERMTIKPVYEITTIKGLKGSDYSPIDWDKINIPVQNFFGLNKNGALFQNDIRRLFAKTGLPEPDSSHFIRTLSRESFIRWYLPYLITVTGKNMIADTNSIFTTATYYWNGRALSLTKNKPD